MQINATTTKMLSHKFMKRENPTRNKIPNDIEQNPACIPIHSNSKNKNKTAPLPCQRKKIGIN
jgi:hypothetical protein